MGRAAPPRGGVRLFGEARDSSKRRTPLHLGLQTAFNAVCVGQSPTPPLTHSGVQNQEEGCRGEGLTEGSSWKSEGKGSLVLERGMGMGLSEGGKRERERTFDFLDSEN